jgi:hypothetical protein
MKDYIPEIRAMLRMIPDAVEQRYPNDAIVLHARDSEKKYLQRILSSDMVLAILDRYNYTRQSLDIWNVSEPRTGDGASSGETLQRQVALWRGFFKCLWHADASKDIDFVRIVYILANGCNWAKQIMSITPSIRRCRWHYHLINETEGKIEEFNAHHSRMQVIAG